MYGAHGTRDGGVSDVMLEDSKRSRRCASLMPVAVGFLLGALATACAATPWLVQFRSEQRRDAFESRIDFDFQVLNISTPRQLNKTMNVFVRWRYTQGADHCPYSQTEENCIQYQDEIHAMILNITAGAAVDTPGLPLMAEWERVNMAICKGIWGKWPTIAALSTSVQVNGDGRTAAQRHGAPFEPGAHGSTCTLGPDDFAPIAFYNYLGNRGAN